MARALILACVALSAACFHGPTPSAARALAIWQDIERAEVERARAATPTPGSAELVLDAERACALAVAASLEVAIEQAEAEVEEAGIMRARQLENPELRLTNFRPGGLEAGRGGLDVAVRVPIPRPWNLHAGARAARYAAAAAGTDVDEVKRRLRGRVLRLFARLGRHRADQELLEQIVRLQAKRRALVVSRVEKALATRLDLKLEDIAYQQTIGDIARTVDHIAEVEDELRRLVGAGPQVRFVVDVAGLRAVDRPRDPTRAIEDALARRPAIQAAASRVGQAEAGAYVARGSAVPWFGWAQMGYTLPAQSGAFGFGVTIEVPLLSWKRGQIRGADAQVRLRRFEELATVRAVVREIEETFQRVERTAAEARRIEAGLLAEYSAAVEIAEKGRDAGVLDPTRAIDLEIRRIEARRRHLSALVDHREAVIDLDAAIAAP